MPKSGMQVQRGESGTPSTLKNQVLGALRFLRFAINVTKYMKGKHTIKDSVVTNAKQNIGIFQEKTILNANAAVVPTSFESTDMQSNEHVVSIVRLSSQMPQKVYDFEVETDHCYYANGILVSNSDAFRYMAIAIKTQQDKSVMGPSEREIERLQDKYQKVFER